MLPIAWPEAGQEKPGKLAERAPFLLTTNKNQQTQEKCTDSSKRRPTGWEGGQQSCHRPPRSPKDDTRSPCFYALASNKLFISYANIIKMT